jgi:hypothetical protein
MDVMVLLLCQWNDRKGIARWAITGSCQIAGEVEPGTKQKSRPSWPAVVAPLGLEPRLS